MQVSSRIWVLWGIINLAPSACSFNSVHLPGLGLQLNYTSLLVAWSITEVIRYCFFAVKAGRPLLRAVAANGMLSMGNPASFDRLSEPVHHVVKSFPDLAQEALGEMPFDTLVWARYSVFLPLYPLGVAGELTMVWLALPTIRRARPWSLAMPNAINFGFDYYIVCIMLCLVYVPGASLLPLLVLQQMLVFLSFCQD